MRLSVKGIQKYTDHRVYYEYPIETLKFEPDDFQGTVILTVEEAKTIRERLCDLALVAGSDRYRKVITKSLNLLIERIEQAEKKE